MGRSGWKIGMLGLVLLTVGCAQWRLKNSLECFCGSQVRMPDDLEIVVDGAAVDSVAGCALAKLVLYFPTDCCTSCSLSKLGDYNELFELCERSEGRFALVPLFAPAEADYAAVHADLQLRTQPFPVYIDRHDAFRRLNPALPDDARCRTFLIDRNDRVVLVGDPLAGEALQTLFLHTLNNLLAHDGIYVPDNPSDR